MAFVNLAVVKPYVIDLFEGSIKMNLYITKKRTLTFGDFPADNSDAVDVGINDVVRLEFHRGEQTFVGAKLFSLFP